MTDRPDIASNPPLSSAVALDFNGVNIIFIGDIRIQFVRCGVRSWSLYSVRSFSGERLRAADKKQAVAVASSFLDQLTRSLQ